MHPRRCYVCNRSSGSLSTAPVHKLPADQILRSQWLSNMNLEEAQILHKTIGICGRHFLPSCYQSLQFDYLRLKSNAIPTLIDAQDWNKLFEATDLIWEHNLDDFKTIYRTKSVPDFSTPRPSFEHNYANFEEFSSVEESVQKKNNTENLHNLKFIVYGNSFLNLFETCFNENCREKLKISFDDNYLINWTCTNGHTGSWTKETRKMSLESSKLAKITKCMGLQYL